MRPLFLLLRLGASTKYLYDKTEEKTIEFEENSPPYQQGFECQASAAASQQSSFSSCKGALEDQLSIKQKENFAFAHAVVIDMSMIRKQMSMTT